MLLNCSLDVISDNSLQEVAAHISNRAFCGLPFGGQEDYIYDEVPAVYLKEHILGARVILQGYGAEDGYVLEMKNRQPIDPKSDPELLRKSVLDISGHVSQILQGAPGLSVSFKGLLERLTCRLELRPFDSLQDVTNQISSNIFGGAPFSILTQTNAGAYSIARLLGLEITLRPSDSAGSYLMQIDLEQSRQAAIGEGDLTRRTVEISPLIIQLLHGRGIEVRSAKSL